MMPWGRRLTRSLWVAYFKKAASLVGFRLSTSFASGLDDFDDALKRFALIFLRMQWAR